jgi:hypothetical protein
VIGHGGSNPRMGELQEQRPTGSEEEDGLLFVRHVMEDGPNTPANGEAVSARTSSSCSSSNASLTTPRMRHAVSDQMHASSLLTKQKRGASDETIIAINRILG